MALLKSLRKAVESAMFFGLPTRHIGRCLLICHRECREQVFAMLKVEVNSSLDEDKEVAKGS